MHAFPTRRLPSGQGAAVPLVHLKVEALMRRRLPPLLQPQLDPMRTPLMQTTRLPALASALPLPGRRSGLLPTLLPGGLCVTGGFIGLRGVKSLPGFTGLLNEGFESVGLGGGDGLLLREGQRPSLRSWGEHAATRVTAANGSAMSEMCPAGVPVQPPAAAVPAGPSTGRQMANNATANRAAGANLAAGGRPRVSARLSSRRKLAGRQRSAG